MASVRACQPPNKQLQWTTKKKPRRSEVSVSSLGAGVDSVVMRASLLAVVLFALVSGCSPDEADVVAVVPEPLSPEPNQVEIDVVRGSQGGSQSALNGIRERPVQVQAEEQCRQLAALEAQLRADLTRYTEQHPAVRRARQEISRLRSELPADGTFCSEQLEQRPRAAEQPHQN